MWRLVSAKSRGDAPLRCRMQYLSFPFYFFYLYCVCTQKVMMRVLAIVSILALVAVADTCPTISGAPSGVGLSGIPQYWSTIDVNSQPSNLSFSFCTPWISPPMQFCGNQNTPSYVAENAGRSGCGGNMWNTIIVPWYWGQDQQAHAIYTDGTSDGFRAIVHIGCGTSPLTLVNATAVENSGPGWNWTMSLESSYMCSGASSCGQWNDCYSCTTAPSGNCGWCANSGMCSQGTSTGPNQGSCSSWDWVSGNCQASPTAAPMTYAPSGSGCSSWTSCYDCTTAPSGNCGWCANSNTCSQGTGTGPNMGSCISWDWLSGECPANPPPTTR